MIKVLAKQRTDLNILHITAQSLNNTIDEFRYLFVTAVLTLFAFQELDV